MHKILIALLFLIVGIAPVFSQEHPEGISKTENLQEEEISLDDLDDLDEEETTPKKKEDGHPGGHPGRSKAHMEAVVAVDATLEHFMGEDGDRISFSSNHEFLVLALAPNSKVRFLIEVIQLTYWELLYSINPRTSFKFGKLAIPFGPIFFHQILGGIVEKPMPNFGGRQFMLPIEWSEYGIAIERLWLDTYAWNLKTKAWITNGLQADGKINLADKTIDFTSGAGAKTDNNNDKAFGLRLQNKFYGKYSLNFSFYTCRWDSDEDDAADTPAYEGDRVIIGNVDAELGYASIKLPVIKNFRFKGQYALLRSNSTQRTASKNETIPWHNKSASMFEATYNGFNKWFDLQFRCGTYDDNWDIDNNKDLINYNIALYYKLAGGVTIIPRYMWNFEKVNETKDNLFFIKAFVEI